MARIEIIMGCMFSGKSTELIRRLKRHRAINESILVINSAKDTRSDKQIIKTHNSDTFDCVKVSDLSLLESVDVDVVAIDEAQFFTGLREFVQRVGPRVKRIILAGLDGDFALDQAVDGAGVRIVAVAAIGVDVQRGTEWRDDRALWDDPGGIIGHGAVDIDIDVVRHQSQGG